MSSRQPFANASYDPKTAAAVCTRTQSLLWVTELPSVRSLFPCGIWAPSSGWPKPPANRGARRSLRWARAARRFDFTPMTGLPKSVVRKSRRPPTETDILKRRDRRASPARFRSAAGLALPLVLAASAPGLVRQAAKLQPDCPESDNWPPAAEPADELPPPHAENAAPSHRCRRRSYQLETRRAQAV
jgi:hypothetical protein